MKIRDFDDPLSPSEAKTGVNPFITFVNGLPKRGKAVFPTPD
jgi:hypothetical protein